MKCIYPLHISNLPIYRKYVFTSLNELQIFCVKWMYEHISYLTLCFDFLGNKYCGYYSWNLFSQYPTDFHLLAKKSKIGTLHYTVWGWVNILCIFTNKNTGAVNGIVKCACKLSVFLKLSVLKKCSAFCNERPDPDSSRLEI